MKSEGGLIMNSIKMPDLNKVLIAGNLTKDPILRHTTNGTSVTNFGIVSSKKFKDNTGQIREEFCHIGVVTWYKLAELCSNSLKKGSSVMIDGELQSRSWKTDNGGFRNIVEIKANKVQFLDKSHSLINEFDVLNFKDIQKEDTQEIDSDEMEKGIGIDNGNQEEDFGFRNLKL